MYRVTRPSPFLPLLFPGRRSGRLRRLRIPEILIAGLVAGLASGLAGQVRADPAAAAAVAQPWTGVLPGGASARWTVPDRLTPGGVPDDAPPPRPEYFLQAAPGLRIGAEAGLDRRGGGLRALVALKLDF